MALWIQLVCKWQKFLLLLDSLLQVEDNIDCRICEISRGQEENLPMLRFLVSIAQGLYLLRNVIGFWNNFSWFSKRNVCFQKQSLHHLIPQFIQGSIWKTHTSICQAMVWSKSRCHNWSRWTTEIFSEVFTL